MYFEFSFSQNTIISEYYRETVDLRGEELRTALWNKIKNHNIFYYNNMWNSNWSIFQETDIKEDGYIWDMYSACNFMPEDHGNSAVECGKYDREHSFPKDWFGGDINPMYSDLFHIYPTNCVTNNKRGNYPYGEVGNNITYTSTNGSKRGPANSNLGYSGVVFEPIDEYKGDFARTYFYMLTCYMDKNLKQGSSIMVAENNNFENWAIEMLLRWHREDPVSQKEIDRNNKIFCNYQHNRNPFIDCPAFADLIWDTNYSGTITFTSESINCQPININYVEKNNTINIINTNNIIKIETSTKIIDINICDIAGRTILKSSVNKKQEKINTNTFENGIYIISIKTENGEIYSDKIVILNGL